MTDLKLLFFGLTVKIEVVIIRSTIVGVGEMLGTVRWKAKPRGGISFLSEKGLR